MATRGCATGIYEQGPQRARSGDARRGNVRCGCMGSMLIVGGASMHGPVLVHVLVVARLLWVQDAVLHRGWRATQVPGAEYATVRHSWRGRAKRGEADFGGRRDDRSGPRLIWRGADPDQRRRAAAHERVWPREARLRRSAGRAAQAAEAADEFGRKDCSLPGEQLELAVVGGAAPARAGDGARTACAVRGAEAQQERRVLRRGAALVEGESGRRALGCSASVSPETAARAHL